jgi:phosphoribosylglycinamide formyltransferase-1
VSRKRTAILISGRGSNMAALIDAARAPDFPAEIVLVISNREDAGGLVKARKDGIETKIVPHKAYASREDFDAALDAVLQAERIDLVCLAGFMRILSDGFARKWAGRVLNIHPSLLPAFKGVRVHEQALEAGVKVSGCSVHFVVPELDSGPIIEQEAVRVLPGDTPEALAARILEQEHRIYPHALKLVAEGKVMLADGKAVFAR